MRTQQDRNPKWKAWGAGWKGHLSNERQREYICDAQNENNRRVSKKKIKGRETVVGRNTPAVSELKSPPKGTGHPSRAGGNGREVKRVPATTRDAGDTGGP